MVGEDGDGLGEDHPVVDAAIGDQSPAVALHEPGQAAPFVALHGGDVVGVMELLAGAQQEVGDLVGERPGAQQRAHRHRPCRRILVGEQTANQRRLLRAGEDLRGPVPSTVAVVDLHQAGGEGVERGHRDRGRVGRGHGGDAPLEVGHAAAAEGDHADGVGGHAGPDQVGGASYQELGLAGTRAADDDLRPVGRRYRRPPVLGSHLDLCLGAAAVGPLVPDRLHIPPF